jgi:hypothetical protein
MNPFEIRAKLIEQADAYLKRQFELNFEFARRTFEELVKQGEKLEHEYKEYMPKMYTPEDVVKEAQKLYGFVKDVK